MAPPVNVNPPQYAIISDPIRERVSVIHDDHSLPVTVDMVGGKAYNLHKLRTLKNISVPAWFTVPSTFFKQFLIESGIVPMIDALDALCKNSEQHEDLIQRAAEKIRETIMQSPINPETALEICKGYAQLVQKTGTNARFAVRSSGGMEDSETSSCAGLYDTLLNIRSEGAIIEGVKSIWSSSFSPRIISERARLGLSQHQCMMGVIVQELVEARVSGVISTIILGNNYPGTQITANFGMGVSVVDGEVSPDSWVLHHNQDYVLEAIRGTKERKIVLMPDKGLKTVLICEDERLQYCLRESEVLRIKRLTSSIKGLYEGEIDIEFAVDNQGQVHFLQARPLVIVKSRTQVIDPRELQDRLPLARGNFSVPGVSTGRLVYIPDLDSLASGRIKLTKRDIAIAFVTTNVWSHHLANIGGLITCEGGPSSHPILLCREKGVPCVIGLGSDIFRKIIDLNGTVVTLDGHNQLIYPGVITTKEASVEDLMNRFKPIQMRNWPKLEETLPPLIHNQMVIERDGKYWRKTPTFPIVGFQAEFNLLRFRYVGELVGKPHVKVDACQINDFVCSLMGPFEEVVALFDGMELAEADKFHRLQREVMQAYSNISFNFSFDPTAWEKYVELAAKFRAYIWLGGALRAYAERKVDQEGVRLELPRLYLDECSEAIQASIPELDTDMHQEIHDLAMEMTRQDLSPVDDVMQLEGTNPDLFQKIRELSARYRFEHQISLHMPTDINLVYKRLLTEIEHIRAGHVFSTSKQMNTNRVFLPQSPHLREWLRISIENRLLQSDCHHLDARSKASVRPKLLELGRLLVEKGFLDQQEQIFTASVQQVGDFMELV